MLNSNHSVEYFELVIKDHSDEFHGHIFDSGYQPVGKGNRYHIGLLKRYRGNQKPLVHIFSKGDENPGFQSENKLRQFISENRHLRRTTYGLVLTYLGRIDPENIEKPVELTYGRIGIAQKMNRK
ncbi:MAG: hypothetical protein JW716_02610 [Candidatus Aenigmarchaeota archaeon]|nr:hypothetical protein [Candidatus Aenigmarchaeota archaeon]